MTRIGRSSDWLLLVASLIGLVLAIAFYTMPGSGVDGTAGALLVCCSSLALVIAALLFLWSPSAPPRIWRTLEILTLLGAAGSALAGYMLMQPWFTAAMLVALVASLGHFVKREAAA